MSGYSMHRLNALICFLLLSCQSLVGSAVNGQPFDFQLRLRDGSFGLGNPVPHHEPGALAWQNEGFDQPFLFDSQSIAFMYRVVDSKEQKNQRAETQRWIFELPGGNQLVGQILDLNEQHWKVFSQALDELNLDRSLVRSITRVGSSGTLLSSGFEVQDWHSPSDSKHWAIDGRGLSTQTPAARIEGRVELPERFELRLTLRWQEWPRFSLLLATATENDQAHQPDAGRRIRILNNLNVQANVFGHGQQECVASIETWSNTLVVTRELSNKADIAPLDELNFDGSVDLTIWVDQPAGKVAARTRGGRLVELDRLSHQPLSSRSRLVIANYGKKLTVEQFEIRSWDGTLPSSRPNAGQVRLTDGQLLEAEIVGFDAQSNHWILQTNNGKRQIASDQLLSGVLADNRLSNEQQSDVASETSDVKQLPSEDLAATIDPPQADKSKDMEMILTDRTYLKVRLLGTSQGQFKFRASALPQEFVISAADIAELIGNNQDSKPTVPTTGPQLISIGESQYFGSLLDNTPSGSTQALHWQPTLSRLASPVSATANGTLRQQIHTALADTSTVAQASEQNVDADAGMRVRLRRVLPRNIQPAVRPPKPIRSEPALTETIAQATASPHGLYFRNGDMAQVTVSSINAAGVHFKSEQTKTIFAAHDRIDRLVFRDNSRDLGWTDPQRQRLLTVPRSLKSDPPTHLVIASSGDVVRGHLVSLTTDTLSIEVRGHVVELPTAEVSEVAWLYQRQWKTADSDQTIESAESVSDSQVVDSGKSDFLVYALGLAQHAMTLRPKRIEGGVLHGTSELLGDTAVQLDRISQLFFGNDVGARVTQLSRTRYPLELATQPRDATNSEQSGSISQQHPLVGQLAPEFSLPTLSDQKFAMKQKRGKYVVLDFWASWCDPCMQALPELDEVIAELNSDQVELVAVNIQEAKSRVQSAVDRLGLTCQVALDLDGQVASAYDVSAIPQTVIIDREGKITHLILGGGPQSREQLKAALEAIRF